jgi:hypothetical protein
MTVGNVTSDLTRRRGDAEKGRAHAHLLFALLRVSAPPRETLLPGSSHE